MASLCAFTNSSPQKIRACRDCSVPREESPEVVQAESMGKEGEALPLNFFPHAKGLRPAQQRQEVKLEAPG